MNRGEFHKIIQFGFVLFLVEFLDKNGYFWIYNF